jgi:hypothetical protein
MTRVFVAIVATIAVLALLGLRQPLVRGELKSLHYMPSQALADEEPNHPLALEKPDTVVTPPYHKPANLPGDWWLLHHPLAQNRGDFDTVECQECHDVDKYCNRCHGYLGVKSVAPAKPAATPTTSQPAD